MLKWYYQVVAKEWDCTVNPPKESTFYMNPRYDAGETVLENATALDAAQKELFNLVAQSIKNGFVVIDRHQWKYGDTFMVKISKKSKCATKIRKIRIEHGLGSTSNEKEL